MIQDMILKAHQTLMASSITDRVKIAAVMALNTPWSFNPKIRKSAGLAKWQTRVTGLQTVTLNHSIEFSEQAFALMCEDEKFNTVSHEYAHIVDVHFRNTSNHDATWQIIHQAMGGTGKATWKNENSFKLANMIKRFIVQDLHSGRQLRFTTTTFNRIQNDPTYKLLKVEVYQGGKLMAEKVA